MTAALPIDDILPDLCDALRRAGRAVLMAPPGAGKTTRVPLALLDLVPGRILMLEPRRLAARAAAERMAETLGETVGQRVGYRIRGEAKLSKATRIEVVTEGILTRMIQSDPELTGIGCVIFDEFHERSLNADLGLALVWEARTALRPDLMLVVMSATLDAQPVAALLDDAPILRSEGRAFPVETRWLGRPLAAGMRLEPAVAGLVEQAVAETAGGVLVFLPGEAEIRRTESLLRDRLPAGVQLRPLFGAMDFAAQRAAIAPCENGRKVVLATSIAETSLTIQDIRVVVDAGRARRLRFDPASGMARLVTERVSRAEAEQRRGRAGRVAEGICFRLWTRGEEGALPGFAPPEMAVADLAGLALELAQWGSDGADLAFLTPPPGPALAEARALLESLGALTGGRITSHGKALAALPLHPRLAHMLVTAGPEAATLAALLEERDPIRGASADLNLRLSAIAHPGRFETDHPGQLHRGTIERIRLEAKRLARMVTPVAARHSPAEMLALAYPDRIGLRRKGDAARYVLSGGKGAVVDEADGLGKHRLIVASDLDGDPREARVRQGLALADAELRRLYGDRIAWVDRCEWSKREGRVVARRQERFGALVLEDRHWPEAPPEAMARGALDGLRQIGLTLSPGAARFRARVNILRADGVDLPDLSDAALLGSEVLLPWLKKARTEADLRALDLTEALRAQLDWGQMAELDRLVPGHFETPLGRRVPIDYGAEVPTIEVKLPEMYGVSMHPSVGPKRHPLRIALLSPGGTPIQVTMDLPGFWDGSYAEVRKEMRGRYPRHPWPENPREADPTTRAKPRGT
ncbi:ATP-dependent helicase HrpB [Rhodobacter capsulatus]|uniref:ATP-dependent helicase HrpB n=1 Tax=Rhodobacter capsulatus TaxID=1061 RepID=UPI0006DC6DE8|nr:ATP-dependent helicase HrpB [Rhodobacter capsulatus]KQB12800.1 ATP-dependent helicase [Rhodobacter capsulatus]KQB13152.1 ATP-dependent helicase [Rhodobacter capsulatus]PZX28605.1 ATP-dependent helicase HrpB [Rhodobacter capsulatus]QNR62881.1 ATP-dependent helicase HrpB [Rhodobacter capsulatus]